MFSLHQFANANKSRYKKDVENESVYNKKLDSNCIIDIEKRIVRIEYPGEVENIDKAIETLGGLDCIELSLLGNGQKLELHFHPWNKYNKACVADKDFKPGILLKVKTLNINDEIKHVCLVEGVSVINFTFNRLCDFQYLPLVAANLETKLFKCDFLYRKILPQNLPELNWLNCSEAKNMDQFLLPVRFSRFDRSQSKLRYVEIEERYEQNLKQVAESKLPIKQQKKVRRIFGKTRQQISIFVSFKDLDIPTKPLEGAIKLLHQRNLEEKIDRVKQLFEQRPIWTKSAIRYNTSLTDEHSKIILPVVAYYFVNGPWRISWVKFGYDPRTDPTARIYQTLDYRIRTAESTKLKVSAKRNCAGKSSLFLGPNRAKRISLKQDVLTKPKLELDERHYVLRPLTIPPARQMFYQLCDLLLPEIQDMISKLPRCSRSFCHPKNGWLPDSFIETCRKVVNDHVLETVQKELLEDNRVLQERTSKDTVKKKEGGSSLNYCLKMLDNVKRGIYKNVTVQEKVVHKRVDLNEFLDEAERISLSSDEENDYTVSEIFESSLPEKVFEGEEEAAQSDLSGESSDEAQFDMDAVQEINDIISQM